MGMSEAEFWAQSIIIWRRRLEGFRKLHGGGARDEESFTPDDYAELNRRCAAMGKQSADKAPARS